MRGAALEQFRQFFPITERYAYMDHAAAGPPSTRVMEAVSAFLTERANHGSLYMGEAKAMCERTRAKVAAFLGASADEIAFTKNTPDGLNMVANGLKWLPGDNIVTSDLEFPANVYPWLNLEDRGVKVRFVRSSRGCIDPDTIVAALDDRTRLVALSWVEFHGGYRNDLARISAACRPRGIHIAVDAIQGTGVLECDVKRLGIDYLAFSSQKWLSAPHAVGIFYCRRDRLNDLRVAAVGQTSVDLGPNYLDYKLQLKETAGRFEPGFINQVGIAGLEASLDLINEAGMARIQDRVLTLTRHLIDGLDSTGVEVFGSKDDNERAGVVSFRHPGVGAADIVASLRQRGIIVSEREGHVRVSPHFYNTVAEVDRLLEVIPARAAPWGG